MYTISKICVNLKNWARHSRSRKSDNLKEVKLALIFIPVAYFSFLFHELGHWLVGEILGNDMILSLNGTRPKSGQYIENTSFYITCGGVCFTILLIIIFWYVIEKYKIVYFYPIVFFNFFFRLFTFALRFDSQDEAKISAFLGIGKYTIAIIVLISLFLITWRVSHVLKRNYKDNLLFVIVSVVCIFLILLTNELLF